MQAKITNTVAEMINQLGQLRAGGVSLDSFPQELLDVRAMLHGLHAKLEKGKLRATFCDQPIIHPPRKR